MSKFLVYLLRIAAFFAVKIGCLTVSLCSLPSDLTEYRRSLPFPSLLALISSADHTTTTVRLLTLINARAAPIDRSPDVLTSYTSHIFDKKRPSYPSRSLNVSNCKCSKETWKRQSGTAVSSRTTRAVFTCTAVY